jgi:hypothetical protein
MAQDSFQLHLTSQQREFFRYFEIVTYSVIVLSKKYGRRGGCLEVSIQRVSLLERLRHMLSAMFSMFGLTYMCNISKLQHKLHFPLRSCTLMLEKIFICVFFVGSC